MKERRILPLAELLAGMSVAEAVTDAAGHVLLPVGASITPSVIDSLSRRNVAGVCVALEVTEDPAQHAARLAAETARLAQRFRHAGDGAATRLLHDAVLACRMNSP